VVRTRRSRKAAITQALGTARGGRRSGLLLAAGVPVEVVSERLGHANATITLTVHQHVHPGMGREAADRFAALLEGRSEAMSIK
jgi:integrase